MTESADGPTYFDVDGGAFVLSEADLLGPDPDGDPFHTQLPRWVAERIDGALA